MAGKAGVHRNYWGEVERGQRNVSALNLLKIARALGCHPSKLFSKF